MAPYRRDELEDMRARHRPRPWRVRRQAPRVPRRFV